MKSGNKNNSKRKEPEKIPLKEKIVGKSKKALKKNKVDTDFHHQHAFKEN